MKFTRQQIWMHNDFHGHAARMALGAQAIMESKTATPAAKDIAARIFNDAKALRGALKKRVDQ